MNFWLFDIKYFMNILLIGSGAREHAIARALAKSNHHPNIICIGPWKNPGILELASEYKVGDVSAVMDIVSFAQYKKVDWAIIGPEAPLEAGVTDALTGVGIRCIGPTKNFAQIETSKSFTRDLMKQYNIPGCPKYKKFESIDGVIEFLNEFGEEGYVIKADGLMGGKGVKVAGDHLKNKDESLAWCTELIDQKKAFVIEEKFIGQEFSFMSFSDGASVAHMPPQQDHKRAYGGDTGPNTGGMGCYSAADHSLPFLTVNDIAAAKAINQKTIEALNDALNGHYRGILYGGFIATKDGVKLIEYNARFGDPEAMSVLAILDTDFVDLCKAILSETLTQNHAKFKNLATVCKYAVPEGYPIKPVKNERIEIYGVDHKTIYFASVEKKENDLYLLGSRAIAIVGVADTIIAAEKIAETEIKKITGQIFHREDIGTKDLIDKRITMMNVLRQ
jgi:phosphoribosylamine---glycine ligase